MPFAILAQGPRGPRERTGLVTAALGIFPPAHPNSSTSPQHKSEAGWCFYKGTVFVPRGGARGVDSTQH